MPEPFSIRRYVEMHFPDAKTSGDFLYFACIYCHKPFKLWVNVRDRRPWFWCFRCETWGDRLKFVMDHQGLPKPAALALIYGGEYGRAQAPEVQVESPPPMRATVLPEEYQPIRLLGHRSPLEARAYRYLHVRRKLSDAQIIQYEIGYAEDGKYHGCIIIPVRRDGEIVYFVARSFFRPGIRYLNPSRGELKLGKSEVLFNYDVAKTTDRGVLVEGVFDAMAVGRSGIALFGKTVSETQLAMLHLAKFDRLEVMLDEDAEGSTYQLVEYLIQNGLPAIPVLVKGDPADRRGDPTFERPSFLRYIQLRLGRQRELVAR